MAGLFRCKKHKIQLNQDEAKERGMCSPQAQPVQRPPCLCGPWACCWFYLGGLALRLSASACTGATRGALCKCVHKGHLPAQHPHRRRTSIHQPLEDGLTHLRGSMSISELTTLTARGTWSLFPNMGVERPHPSSLVCEWGTGAS